MTGKEQCITCCNWNKDTLTCDWVAVTKKPNVKITAQEGNMGICPLYEESEVKHGKDNS